VNREILLQSLEDFMQETDARLTSLEAKPQVPEPAVDWKAFAAKATDENRRLTAEVERLTVQRNNLADQLDNLQERRDQLDMMATEECCTLWAALVTPYAATETGKAALGKLVRKYGLGEICDCMRISVNQYLERTRDGEIVRESVHKAFDYIGRIARNRKRNRKRIQERPYLEDLYHICNDGYPQKSILSRT
jgi:hypothetical protein